MHLVARPPGYGGRCQHSLQNVLVISVKKLVYIVWYSRPGFCKVRAWPALSSRDGQLSAVWTCAPRNSCSLVCFSFDKRVSLLSWPTWNMATEFMGIITAPGFPEEGTWRRQPWLLSPVLSHMLTAVRSVACDHLCHNQGCVSQQSAHVLQPNVDHQHRNKGKKRKWWAEKNKWKCLTLLDLINCIM